MQNPRAGGGTGSDLMSDDGRRGCAVLTIAAKRCVQATGYAIVNLLTSTFLNCCRKTSCSSTVPAIVNLALLEFLLKYPTKIHTTEIETLQPVRLAGG
jgi:hypothetical protein